MTVLLARAAIQGLGRNTRNLPRAAHASANFPEGRLPPATLVPRGFFFRQSARLKRGIPALTRVGLLAREIGSAIDLRNFTRTQERDRRTTRLKRLAVDGPHRQQRVPDGPTAVRLNALRGWVVVPIPDGLVIGWQQRTRFCTRLSGASELLAGGEATLNFFASSLQLGGDAARDSADRLESVRRLHGHTMEARQCKNLRDRILQKVTEYVA